MSKIKRMILDAGLRKQQQLIDDFRIRIKDVMKTDGNINEESYDNHQQTFQAELLSEVSLLNDELEFANQELLEMKKIDSDLKHKQVEYGAVVETDLQTFFVSASLEVFNAGDKSYFGVSINSPIYKSMRGKKVGDRFHTRKTDYVIKQIY